MNTTLNPKLLDTVNVPGESASLPLRTGTVVELFSTAPNAVLIEVADDEGVPLDISISEMEKSAVDWRSSAREIQSAHASGAEDLYEQGVLLLQNGLIEKAKSAFAEAFRVEPRFAGTLMNLANAQANAPTAIFLYQMILELQPTYRLALENLAIAHLNQGVVYARRGVMDKAIEEFNETLLLHPAKITLELCRNNLVASYTSLGMQLAAIKRYQEGVQFFFLAFQLNPSDDITRRNLALALIGVAASEHKGRGIPSKENFKRFVQMGLTPSECLNAFGATLAGLGFLSDAKIVLRKASELDPANELAKSNLHLLESPEQVPELPLGMIPLEAHSAQLATLQ